MMEKVLNKNKLSRVHASLKKEHLVPTFCPNYKVSGTCITSILKLALN